MPNHGELQSSHFKNQELVFSGHFHKRQNQKNIWYIGNAFPHNYADAWDDDRGMMILEWGQEPQFKVWTDAPKFRTLKLSRLIDEKDTLLKSKMYLKVNLDIDISFEEANYLKETFSNDYNIREFAMFQEKARLDEVVDTDLEVNFQSVDQVVTQELVNISSNQYDHKMLLDIYRKL
jgi:hypothetical protein